MITNRRYVLAGAGAATAVGLCGIPAFANRVGAIGLQLFTVRELFQKDPVETLRSVARIGYREVEFGGGGYETMDHAMLRRTIDGLGMRAPSIHLGYDSLVEDLDASVAMAKTLGADTIVLPGIPKSRRDEAGWPTVLATVNRLSERLKRAGLGFAYHNHDFEFTSRFDGVSMYDRLLAGTDPALLKIEVDIFWVQKAGVDVTALIDRLGSRIYAYHVKDRRTDGSMTAVGDGQTDFGALFRLNGGSGVRHFYVENDEAPAPFLPDITKSLMTLRSLRY